MTPMEHFHRAEELALLVCSAADSDGDISWEDGPSGFVYIRRSDAIALGQLHATLAQIGTPLSWQGRPTTLGRPQ